MGKYQAAFTDELHRGMVWMINRSDAQRSVANLEVEHLGTNLLLAFCSFGFQRKHLVTC